MNTQNFLRHRRLPFSEIFPPSTASFATAQSTKSAAGGGRSLLKSAIALAALLLAGSVFGQDIVINAFEGANYGTWTVSGTAFGTGPVATPTIAGIQGTKYVTTKGTINAAGTLTSSTFTIQRSYLNFLLAGRRYLPADVGVELIVNGQVVRAASASSEEALSWRTWNVGPWSGQQAQIRINDDADAGWIAIDQIVQSNSAASRPIDASVLGDETYRPKFHFTSEAYRTWDPCGFFYYNGKWHLTCDYWSPVGGGKMAWGWAHAIGDDLIHWEHQPVAITSDFPDITGAGSAIVDWGNASGFGNGVTPPIVATFAKIPPSPGKSTQCLAYSTDGGFAWTKYAGNPVIATADKRDRGPSVFKYKPNGMFYMLLSLTHDNLDPNNAQFALFRSSDLKSWGSPIQIMGSGTFYYEWPDMFELPIDGNPAQTKWVLFSARGKYKVGSFDGNAFTPDTPETEQTAHYGNWYANHSYNDAPYGRRIQIAWMSYDTSATADSYPGMPFEQQLSLPRELSLRNTPQGLRVFSMPVREIAFLRDTTQEWSNVTLPPGTNPLSAVNADLVDLFAEVQLGTATKILLNLRGQAVEYTVATSQLKCAAYSVSLPAENGRIKLRALLDRSTVEVFGNGGVVDISTVFFPHPANHDLSITAVGGTATIVKMKLHELEPDQAAAPILNVNFDADTAGGLPSQGSCGNTGDAGLTYKVVAASTTPVDPFGGAGNKSLYLKDASPTKSCTVNYDLSPPAENYASVEVDVHYVNSAFISIGSGATYATKLWFNGTSLDYQVGATWVSLATIGASQTYSIAVHLDVAAQTYSVWVNGIEEVTDEAFNAAVSQVDRVQLAAGSSGGSNHSAFFDNLSVKAVP